MVANVSAALQTSDFPSYSSRLTPVKMVKTPDYYITADHVLDPFTWIRPFRPDTPEWTKAREDGDFIEATALKDLGFLQGGDSARFLADPKRAILESHPHGFANYIANPRVHLPILSKILRRGIVDKEKATQVEETYEADVKNSLKSDVVTEAKALLADAVRDAPQTELSKLTSLQELYQRLKALHEVWSKS